jgi:putative DNA primase/helicase
VIDIAAQMQCPVEFLAVGAMVAAGAVVGNRIGIQPKQHDIGWVEVPNLWGAVVGRPGVMKSPALAKVLAPLKRLEDKRLQAFQSVLAQYQIDKMVHEASKKRIEEQIRKGGTILPHQMPVEPTEPQPPRLLLNDATYQKLGQVLSGNPHGVLVFQDELAGLLVRLDTVGQEPARAFYLEAWNGLQPYVFDRIERGTVRIPRLCFSLLGGLQPSKLREYLKGAVNGGKTDDGLAQRLQLLVYPDISKEWALIDRAPDINAIQAADKVFDQLDSLNPAALGANIPTLGDGIPTLSFNDAAQAMFNDWWGKLELSLRTEGRHPALESHLSKFRKLIPALALLDHLIEGAGGPITEASLARAIRWGKFLFQHAKRAYAAVTASSKDAAKSLADKLLQGALTDGFTVRDVYRKNWSALSAPKDAEEALEILIDSGWLRAYTDKAPGSDGRPTIRYLINPGLEKAA